LGDALAQGELSWKRLEEEDGSGEYTEHITQFRKNGNEEGGPLGRC
jgi:hypothetical protein